MNRYMLSMNRADGRTGGHTFGQANGPRGGQMDRRADGRTELNCIDSAVVETRCLFDLWLYTIDNPNSMTNVLVLEKRALHAVPERLTNDCW